MNISRLLKVLSVISILLTAASAQTGTLKVYLSPPAAQSSAVSGVTTETFDALTTGIRTTAYTPAGGIGTYTGSAANPFAIMAHDQYGGATDSTHASPTNYIAVGNASSSTSPVILTLTNPASYFGFWWSAGDQYNRVDLYSGSTLYATFSTQDILTFLNNGNGNIKALNGSSYATKSYFGNPNITSGSNDSTEPFVYVSFVISGVSINKLAFYNLSTTTAFESDNHSVIFAGKTVTIPTTFVPVETLPLTPTAATPAFSPAEGTYTSVQSVAIASATPGAAIRYTTDGSTPSETVGTVYSGPVTVGGTETLKAIAYKSGLADSGVASALYTINLPVVAAPEFNPKAGTYTSAQKVTITSDTPGASIRYTTDGSTPSETAGTVYGGPVTVSATETIKAIAYKSGMADSAGGSALYTINLPVVAAPEFSPKAGTYTSAQKVTITSDTPGASIRYTTDGSTPSETVGTVYSGPVTVSSTQTIKAIAYESGMTNSAVGSALYTISLPVVEPPEFSPKAGTYTSVQSVTISSITPSATIRYTTDGSTPSETAGTVYSTAVAVGATETIKAIAYKTGVTDSTVASALYTINLPVVAAPTFSPVAGTYASTQSVTISSITPSATIRYTTDGSTPSETAGTVYSTAVAVGATETIKAIAYKTGVTDSTVASALYTINLPVVAAPTFNPPAEPVVAGTQVTIASATTGALISYTTDGSTPSATNGVASPVTVTVSAAETINAIAYKSGMTNSAVASAPYTMAAAVATPTFNPPAGPVVAGTQVTIASTTSGALISYTTDGSTPAATGGAGSPVSVAVSAAETINAIAYKSGMNNSAVASAPYTMAAAVVAPTFNPPAGPVVAGTQVTIASAITGALISYTTDGSTPSATNGVASPVTVTVSAAETINAIAYKTGMAGSAVASATYAISTGVNGYSHQRAITIPRNNMGILGGPMRDFPMLVSGTYSFLATTANRGQVQNANGFDIVFTADSAGTTKLDHEINSYDPTTGAINMWVRIPSLQYCDTVFFINYGNVAITTSQENKAGVWKSHYNAVLHMGETDGNLLYDSTGNGNNATKVSATSPSPVSGGLFGVAQSFNGTSDYAILPPSLTAGHKSFVLSFWVNTTELGAGDTNGHYYSAE